MWGSLDLDCVGGVNNVNEDGDKVREENIVSATQSKNWPKQL